MNAPVTVYIIDQIVPRAGMAQRLLSEYLARYAPGARVRGMTLEYTWVVPPVWLEDATNTLTFVWSVPGAAGWWGARVQQDATVADWWWKDAADLVESRQRTYASSPSDLEALARV